MKRLLAGETIQRFLPPVVASIVVGLLSAGFSIYLMLHLMDARVSSLEKLPARVDNLEKLDGRIKPIEAQISRHEKALERDFARHERTVLEIAHKTEDQEKRLTRLETLVTETQALLSEIRADVKILLRGGSQ